MTVRSASVHPLLNPGIAFVPEEESAALSRYKGFAQDLFERLYEALPALRGRFKFYRDPRTSDLWSVCQTGDLSFGLQLDPDIEVICLWQGQDAWEEIGHWPPAITDPVALAINWVRALHPGAEGQPPVIGRGGPV